MAKQEMTLSDWFDDLCVRFILNLPVEERSSLERICFQIEEAQWYYEDFIRPLNPSLPSMNLKPFSQKFFQHIFDGVGQEHYLAAFSRFVDYKTRVPVRGAILLNQEMDQVVLVKGWKKGSRWSFPRGKINKDERDLDCAVREVYEETGLDLHKTNLLDDESKMKSIKVSMREQEIMVYIVRGVSMDYMFEPQTRKEISDIAWYKITDLPTIKSAKSNSNRANMFYMVAPFVGPLMKWIDLQLKLEQSTHKPAPSASAQMSDLLDGLRQSSAAAKQAPSVGLSAPDKSAELMKLLNIGSKPEPRTHSDAFSTDSQFEPSSLVPSGILSNSTPTCTYSQPVAHPIAPPVAQTTSWGSQPVGQGKQTATQHPVGTSLSNSSIQQQLGSSAPYNSVRNVSVGNTGSSAIPTSDYTAEPKLRVEQSLSDFSMPLSKHSQALLSIFGTPSPRPSTTAPVSQSSGAALAPAPASIPALVPASSAATSASTSAPTAAPPVPEPAPVIEILKSNRRDPSRLASVMNSSSLSSSESPSAAPEPTRSASNTTGNLRAVSGSANPRANQDRRGGARRGRGGGTNGRDSTRRVSEFRPNPQKPITILSRPKPPPTEEPANGVGTANAAAPSTKEPNPVAPSTVKPPAEADTPSKPAPLPSNRDRLPRHLKDNTGGINVLEEDPNSRSSPAKPRTRHRSRSRRRIAIARPDRLDAQKTSVSATPAVSAPASGIASPAAAPAPALPAIPPLPVTAPISCPPAAGTVAPPPLVSPSTEASNKTFFLGFLASLKK